ncbi:MAG: insulinase family protein, partial [Bacteroidaceae bacterium]|nr:insulinase family protein [Bacteroidaceae bacterium]
AVTGNISFKETVMYTEKWFGPIPKRNVPTRQLPLEPKQTVERRMTVERNVPMDALYMTFHMCNRLHPDYYVHDMMSDLLSNGNSSRFIRHLIQEKQLFSNIDAYIAGSIEEGTFHINGRSAPGISLEEAEAAVWQELEAMKTEKTDLYELEKVKNHYESEQIFGNINYLNVATNLAFFELISKAEDINDEVAKYRAVGIEDIQRVASETFVRENCSVLYYKKNDIPTTL